MNNDLISREALKKALDNIINEQTMTETEKLIFEDFKIFIDNAPTVKPCENCDLYFKAMTKEAQKGNWIVKTKSTFPQYQPDEYECPFCKTIVTYKTNYCHNCGAIMKGGAE